MSSVSSSPADVSATWQAISLMATAPTGSRSVVVRLAVLKPIGQTTAEARFDDVSVTVP